MRGVLQRERQVEVRVKRIADAVAVRVHRYAGSVGRTRGATSKFVGVRPRVVVIVQVLHQRGLARRGHTGHQLVGLAVAVGVLGTGRVEREGVRSSHAPSVGGRFGTVAGTVTVAVWIAWAGVDGEAEFVIVGNAVPVHVVVHQVANAVPVHVFGDAGRVQRVAFTSHFGCVEVAVVVVVVIGDEPARTVRVLVGVSVAVGVDRQGRVERRGVGASIAGAVASSRTVTEAIAVGVRVAWVGTDDALVGVGHAVVVVVLVLDEGVGLHTRVGVVVGQLVGHAVAVEVLQNLKPERGFNGARRVGGVRPNRVGCVVHRLGRRAGDDTGGRVEHQALGQVGRDFPRGAGNGVGRVDRRRFGVVHKNSWTERARANGVAVGTGQTDRRHGVGAVTDAVAVGVRIE